MFDIAPTALGPIAYSMKHNNEAIHSKHENG